MNCCRTRDKKFNVKDTYIVRKYKGHILIKISRDIWLSNSRYVSKYGH